MEIKNDDVVNVLKTALAEDLGTEGDITSQAIFEETDTGEAEIRAKQAGILSGVTLIAPLFELIDSFLSAGSMPNSTRGSSDDSARPSQTKIDVLCADGEALEPGKVICKVKGPVRSILSGERTILNLMQRLSGIATATARMIEILKGGKTRLLDTRKTTPGLRALEKAAVRHGGGGNHRFGLFDMILIKDTHVKRAGGVKPALEKALRFRGNKPTPLIEVEVQSTKEFFEALPLEPNRIMLDNMSPHEIETCVKGRNAAGLNIELEASGGITVSALSAIAATGVDFISSGAITHSAPALDIHLVMIN